MFSYVSPVSEPKGRSVNFDWRWIKKQNLLDKLQVDFVLYFLIKRFLIELEYRLFAETHTSSIHPWPSRSLNLFWVGLFVD